MLKKSFRDLVIENDAEYVYWVRSTEDIHKLDYLTSIKLACLPYKQMMIEANIKTLPAKNNEFFPNFPDRPVFIVKVYLGLPVNSKVLAEEICMRTFIKPDHLCVEAEHDEEPETMTGDYKPMASVENEWNASTDIEITGAQELVGTERVASFIKELEVERKNREKAFKSKEVYETFCVDSQSLGDMIGRAVRPGYYLCEAIDSRLIVEGPFKNKPDNLKHKTTKVKADVLTESTNPQNRSIMELTVHQPNDTSEMPGYTGDLGSAISYEVEVRDTDTGRSYHTVVKAADSAQARDAAIEQIANKERVSTSRLTAMEPDEG